MTEINSTLDRFFEVEMKEHRAALIRQMVAIATIIGLMLMLVGLHQ
jgi:hypothetical protein